MLVELHNHELPAHRRALIEHVHPRISQSDLREASRLIDDADLLAYLNNGSIRQWQEQIWRRWTAK